MAVGFLLGHAAMPSAQSSDSVAPSSQWADFLPSEARRSGSVDSRLRISIDVEGLSVDDLRRVYSLQQKELETERKNKNFKVGFSKPLIERFLR